ncbi:MAG: SH3 domain-containing protein [Clostridia bacterium]|nr:SH3 domain-containing protein [Clostridia bacterium]
MFNLSPAATSPAIGTSPNGDPFAGAKTSDPFGLSQPTSIPGYNPFDPDASAAPSISASGTAMFVTTATVKVRRSPKDYARTITVLTFGQQVTVVGINDEWACVVNPNGKKGYCLANQLSATDPNTLSKLMYVQPPRLALSKAPAKRSGRYRWLNMGDTITMVAITDDGLWARVTDGSIYGYVPSFALDDQPAAQTGTTMWCSTSTTPLLVNPESWRQIGSLSLGQPVTLVGTLENGAIAKIRSSAGYVAYCDAAALTNANPVGMNTAVYAQVSGRILYHQASDEARTANIGKNAKLTLLGVDSSQYWALVKYGRRKYFTPYVLVAPTRVGKGYRTVTVSEDAPLYRNSTDVISTLPAGTRVYLAGVSGTTAKVVTISDGVTPAAQGFVALRSLKGE